MAIDSVSTMTVVVAPTALGSRRGVPTDRTSTRHDRRNQVDAHNRLSLCPLRRLNGSAVDAGS